MNEIANDWTMTLEGQLLACRVESELNFKGGVRVWSSIRVNVLLGLLERTTPYPALVRQAFKGGVVLLCE